MTRRERLAAKAERLRTWAAKREDTAAALLARNEPYRGDVAFNTQPGHIPERARANRRAEMAFEHGQKAAAMQGRASGIASQLDHSIYSDDADAPERLQERIMELTAKREAMKARNAAYRKGHAAELRALTPYGRDQVLPHASWELTNLGANIRRLQERVSDVQQRQERTAAAATSGGVLVEGAEWVRVTFAEKPARATIEVLKAAGFRWSGGSWVGQRAQLPAELV